MSTDEDRIICRRCGENVSMTVGSCPRCGAEIRGRRGPLMALIIGLLIVASSLLRFEQLLVFGVLGLILAFGGGYFIWDQRRRIRRATEAHSESE